MNTLALLASMMIITADPVLPSDGVLPSEPLLSGDHLQRIEVEQQKRSYLLHVPKDYDGSKPLPVVLVFHGAMTNARIMAAMSGLSKTADQHGFFAVYANGTGPGVFLTFNVGGLKARFDKQNAEPPDDVVYTSKVLDHLKTIVSIDEKRVYATGLSNGGMMSYKLAAELSDRIAAIAPVAGTMEKNAPAPKRAVPILHFHGTKDTLVPFNGPRENIAKFLKIESVPETIKTWVKHNQCEIEPSITKVEDKVEDGTTVLIKTHAKNQSNAEVILVEIQQGGHTWPGRRSFGEFLGNATQDISANEMMWEFFQKYQLP